ncbi:hypothetical protein ACA910_000970 [Epithemia clementina (nom. ined.)]
MQRSSVDEMADEADDDASRPTEDMIRPVRAKYEPDRHLFLLTRKRGKSISNGGFGLVMTKIWLSEDAAQQGGLHNELLSVSGAAENTTIKPLDGTNDQPKESNSSDGVNLNSDEQDTLNDVGNPLPSTTARSKTVTTTTEEYLQIEEVLFLFERGLLEAVDERETVMEMPQLYALLNHHTSDSAGAMLSLPIYLSYAHLRQQGYRVVRHSPERRKILMAMEEDKRNPANKKRSPENNDDDNGADYYGRCKKPFSVLKRELRDASCMVVPPAIGSGVDGGPLRLAWDVYPPDQNFSRSAPGLPSFSVLVTSYSEGMITFSQISQCIRDSHPTPIKIATISDGGIVVMFGVTDECIPPISRTET